jgi:hypothetical protein
LIGDVPPECSEDICFTTEAFCSICAETPIRARSVPEFVHRAVEFANDTLWGTLAASIFAHPASLQDPATAAAVESAIADLRYGTVGVNVAANLGFVLMETPWGGFPGADIYDVQSGFGWAHNNLMFEKPQKSVVRTPFRMKPRPLSFVSRGPALLRFGRRVTAFAASPSPTKVPGIIWAAMRS